MTHFNTVLFLPHAGQLNYTVAFKIFSYLEKEKKYLPWKAAIGSLSYVRSMFRLTGAYGALQVSGAGGWRHAMSEACVTQVCEE